jgi:hypothetical protein
VGDFIIFNFNLGEDRTQLDFKGGGPLEDRVANNAEELDDIGPYDGYLYVLSLDQGGDE